MVPVKLPNRSLLATSQSSLCFVLSLRGAIDIFSHQSLPLFYRSHFAARSQVIYKSLKVPSKQLQFSSIRIQPSSLLSRLPANTKSELRTLNHQYPLQAHTPSNNNMPWKCCKKRDGDCRNPSNPDHEMFCLSCWHRRCDKCPPVYCRMAVRSMTPLATREADANNFSSNRRKQQLPPPHACLGNIDDRSGNDDILNGDLSARSTTAISFILKMTQAVNVQHNRRAVSWWVGPPYPWFVRLGN